MGQRSFKQAWQSSDRHWHGSGSVARKDSDAGVGRRNILLTFILASQMGFCPMFAVDDVSQYIYSFLSRSCNFTITSNSAGISCLTADRKDLCLNTTM